MLTKNKVMFSSGPSKPEAETEKPKEFQGTGEEQQSSEQSTRRKRTNNFWPSMVLGSSLALLALGINAYNKSVEEDKNKIHQSSTSGGLNLGGPFLLTNQYGERFSDKDMHGSFVIMYFGFAHCPDFCPTEMKKIGKVVDLVNKKHGDVLLPIFVSVDPLRDTPQALREYSKSYHDKFIYLTGSMDEILDVSKKFRVYFSKPDPNDPHYQVDHSLYSFFLDKEGKAIEIFSNSKTADEIVEMVSNAIKQG